LSLLSAELLIMSLIYPPLLLKLRTAWVPCINYRTVSVKVKPCAVDWRAGIDDWRVRPEASGASRGAPQLKITLTNGTYLRKIMRHTGLRAGVL
jgi:hypothetical protein